MTENITDPCNIDRHVVIDTDACRITVDGEQLPFYIAEAGPTVEPHSTHGYSVVVVPLLVFAHTVDVTGDRPDLVRHLPDTAEWAHEQSLVAARRHVVAQLHDIITDQIGGDAA